MRVALLSPAWDRSCEHCETYLIREDGTEVLDRRTSLPLLRTREPTPCHKCPKVPIAVRSAGGDPKEMRKHAADLTPRDRKCLAFYRKCRAVNRFPEDPVVEWYAAVLRDVYDFVDLDAVRRIAAGVEFYLKSRPGGS